MKKHLEHDAIARRAHEIYLAEGRPDDRASEHWYRAEQELAAESSRPALSEVSTISPTGRHPTHDDMGVE